MLPSPSQAASSTEAHTAPSGPYSQHLVNPRSYQFSHFTPKSLQLPLLSTPTAHTLSPALTSSPLPWITATVSQPPLSAPHPSTCLACTCPHPRAIFLTPHFCRLLPLAQTPSLAPYGLQTPDLSPCLVLSPSFSHRLMK